MRSICRGPRHARIMIESIPAQDRVGRLRDCGLPESLARAFLHDWESLDFDSCEGATTLPREAQRMERVRRRVVGQRAGLDLRPARV